MDTKSDLNVTGALNATTSDNNNHYCRSTAWHILVGSSIGTYVTFLVIIKVGGVLWRPGDDDPNGTQDGYKGYQKSPSLRARLHLMGMTIMKGSNTVGKVVLVINSMLVITSFVVYILLTYQFTDAQKANKKHRTLISCHSVKEYPLVHLDFAMNIYYLLVFFLRMLSTVSIESFWLSVDTISDHATIIPSFIMYVTDKHTIAFQFVRLTELKYLVNALIYCTILQGEKYIRLMGLLIRIITIWGISAGFFQLIESLGNFWITSGDEDSHFIAYHDCFYYMLITMSTVGYGDFYPRSILGKFFIIIFIIVALGTFTSIIPEISDILTDKKKYRRIQVHLKSGKKHVVVVGKFTASLLKTFFDDFFHSERSVETREFIAMLCMDEPDLELKALIKTRELYVTYLQGSVMSVRDLQRACVRDASAVIIMADSHPTNEEDEDMKNIMRVIAIKDFCPEVQVLVQLQLYRSKTYLRNIPDWSLSHGDHAICVNEIKYGLLAQNCLVPGLSTLLCNLLILRSVSSDRYPPMSWQSSYIDGVEFEFYKVPFSANFHGLSFLKAAEVCADQLGISLLAVEEGNCSNKRTVINPGSGLIIDTDRMQAFIIARNEKEAKRLSDYAQYLPSTMKPNSIDASELSSNPSTRLSTLKSRLQYDGVKPRGNSVNDNTSSFAEEGNMFDSSGYFHWIPNHPMDDVLLQVQNRYHFKDHIIVCITEKSPDACLNLTTFIMPLRASSIQQDKIKDIIFVGQLDVLQNEWTIIQNFPRIYILDGSPLNRANLRLVNIEICHSCIILSPKTTPVEPDAQMDRETILCTLNIKTMRDTRTRRKLGDTIHIISELYIEESIAYLDQDDEEEVNESFMTQAFATGRAFFVSLLGSIVTTIYFNQASLGFLRTIVTTVDSEDFEIDLNEQGFHFMPSDPPISDDHSNHSMVPSLKNGSHKRSRIELLNVQEPPLAMIFNSVPFIKWKDFCLAVLRNLEIVCIGLSRLQVERVEDAKNHRFVITLPRDGVVISNTDMVYCLTPPRFSVR